MKNSPLLARNTSRESTGLQQRIILTPGGAPDEAVTPGSDERPLTEHEPWG